MVNRIRRHPALSWSLVAAGAVLTYAAALPLRMSPLSLLLLALGVTLYTLGIAEQLASARGFIRAVRDIRRGWISLPAGVFDLPDGRRITVAASATAASIVELQPATGSVMGGTTVRIRGNGFVCTPAVPRVVFDRKRATVIQCGADSVVVITPKHRRGDVVVTVINEGGAASNALRFTFE